MASDLTEQNENEQENTEQNDLQQIESLKIQVSEGWWWNTAILTDLYIFYHVTWESHCAKQWFVLNLNSIPRCVIITWHLYQGQNSLEQIS